ncbi:hypothetical protein, conserved [Trypanosoma vivax Y486]|uniref:Methylated-DNA-[protein]-cysteine S-methyltransferase DNA binding domain-containing protein n=1 Tax=Trypanosoma vivax (strain Y486) TaxID=1055687 RepID=F9WLZ7_TRYVY|nr:hypothetical protein TvY486_0012400 [Trypanosoma vivax Y486]CCD18924.1 hypothetical protein, conserved [Trypanosoma vivax Y486]|eukprot:CCD18545.1 hypothetical protein TvY486_0012400 [Trypanosoma vivax Y486]
MTPRDHCLSTAPRPRSPLHLYEHILPFGVWKIAVYFDVHGSVHMCCMAEKCNTFKRRLEKIHAGNTVYFNKALDLPEREEEISLMVGVSENTKKIMRNHFYVVQVLRRYFNLLEQFPHRGVNGGSNFGEYASSQHSDARRAEFQELLSGIRLTLPKQGPMNHSVWDELRKIPLGTVLSETEFERRCGLQGKGSVWRWALRWNMHQILIPSHRIVGVHRGCTLLSRDQIKCLRDIERSL